MNSEYQTNLARNLLLIIIYLGLVLLFLSCSKGAKTEEELFGYTLNSAMHDYTQAVIITQDSAVMPARFAYGSVFCEGVPVSEWRGTRITAVQYSYEPSHKIWENNDSIDVELAISPTIVTNYGKWVGKAGPNRTALDTTDVVEAYVIHGYLYTFERITQSRSEL